MAEILFYHMTESTLDEALPPLLEKSVERSWKVVVQAGSEERRDALDSHLWTWREESFLGHGVDTDPLAAEQPILLTASERNLNAATVRFIIDGAVPPPLDGYERAVFLFDGHDEEQVAQARGQWKALKAAGHQVTYWQQTEGRRWERKG